MQLLYVDSSYTTTPAELSGLVHRLWTMFINRKFINRKYYHFCEVSQFYLFTKNLEGAFNLA